MPQSITEKILSEYSQLRSREALERNHRMAEIHKKFPRLEEINKEITAAGMKLAMGAAAGEESEKKLVSDYNRTTAALKEEKSRIISENGIFPDYDKIIYTCPICRDTGYVGSQKCRCLLAKLTKALYDNSNLSESMKKHTFDDFSLSYYSDKPDQSGISDRQRAKKALTEAKLLCRDPKKYDRSIVFFGNSGLGKTFLSGCISHELIEKGYSVLYIRSSRLFSVLEAKKFGKRTNEPIDELIDTLYSCDLLVIDDLGTEIPSKYNVAFLYDLVNDRLLGSKKIVINTNLSMEELSKAYTPRLMSRMFESFYALKLTGTDIRRLKSYESER